jgi:hypothetical protein
MRWARLARAAAKSICPAGAAAGLAAPPGRGGAADVGRGAEGTGGFPGALGAPGFDATGGAGGFVLAATGGGALPNVLEGLEGAGELFSEAAFDVEAAAGFFHGAAEPLAGAIPGNTDTGLAEASAARDLTGAFGVGAATGFGVAAAAGADGGGLLPAGGGGGGGGAALTSGGNSSR